MDVYYIYRKKQPGYFSIEKVFMLVASFLQDKAVIKSLYMPYSRLLPWNVLRNFTAIRNITTDVYHVTGDVHYIVLGMPGQKTVLTIHDCVFLHNTTGVKRWLLKYFFLKWPVRHCHAITTISEKSRQEIIRYSGCSPDKVSVVPNPVGDQFYYSERAFNDSCPVCLFVGTAPNKNLERVIHALEGVPCHLVIVGNINEKHRQILSDAHISFRQLSCLSEKALADVYANCDIVLFPSTYEGFGLPVIEAQKSGRPVITSNISPMKEVAGKGACLVNPLDTASIKAGIERVIRDKAYRERIVQNGFDNVKQYEVPAIAEKYLQVYKKIYVR